MLSSKTINICLTTVPGGRWSAVKGVTKHHAVRITIIRGGVGGEGWNQNTRWRELIGLPVYDTNVTARDASPSS